MNKLNLLRLKNLYGVVADTSGGHLALQIPYPRGDGTNIYLTGYGGTNLHESDRFAEWCSHLNDPTRKFFVEPDPSMEIAVQTLDAMSRHALAISTTAKDRSLSIDGKATRNAVATAEALKSIGIHYAKLRSIGAGIDSTERSLFDPPAVDAVSVVRDTYLLQRFHGMDRQQQLTLLDTLGTPAAAELLLALRRDPLPMNSQDNELVSRAWHDKVAAEKPAAVAAYQVARDNHEWAMGLTQLLARTVSDPELNATAGQLPRVKLYEALKPTGGADVLSFAPSESVMYECLIESQSRAA